VCGPRLAAEAQPCVAALARLLREDASASANPTTAIIRSWSSSPLFPVRANGA
jgi:hypothetical protein